MPRRLLLRAASDAGLQFGDIALHDGLVGRIGQRVANTTGTVDLASQVGWRIRKENGRLEHCEANILSRKRFPPLRCDGLRR